MAEILPFKKKSGESPHHRFGDVPTTTFKIPNTPLDVFLDCRDDIIGEWQRNAVQNNLNEYFFSKLPHNARPPKNSDCVNSLDILGSIEQKLEMIVASFYPGGTPNNVYGYLAAFTFKGEIYTTPPDIMSEANARAMNVLFYLSFIKQMESLGWINKGEK